MDQIDHGEVRIESESDIVNARKIIRDTATNLGFEITDITRIVTAASELTRNIYQHAGSGIMQWKVLTNDAEVGLELTFDDHGPGIPDVNQAMEAGFSTGNGLGMGLPGSKRLMDEMKIDSTVGKGTTVVICKWLKA